MKIIKLSALLFGSLAIAALGQSASDPSFSTRRFGSSAKETQKGRPPVSGELSRTKMLRGENSKMTGNPAWTSSRRAGSNASGQKPSKKAEKHADVNLSSYTDLKTAITAIGTKDSVLVIDKTAGVTADTVIPENIRLKVNENGTFLLRQGVTLRIQNGAEFEAPLMQVFSGGGVMKWEVSVPKLIYPEWFGVVRGSAVSTAVQTSNTVAINKAIDSLHTTKNVTTANRSGVIYFSDKQEYRFNGMIDLAGRRWITLTSGVPRGANITYTGKGSGTFISIASAMHVTISNLEITYVNSAFRGYLIKSGLSGLSLSNGFLSGATSYISIHDNLISGLASSEDTGAPGLDAILLQYDNGQIGYIERNQFFYGYHGIVGKDGSPFSEVVMIRDNTFKMNKDYSIKNAGSAWNIESNTFEPSYSARADTNWSTIKAYTQDDYYAYNVSFSHNWMGDTNGMEPGMPAFEGSFLGVDISNNLFELNQGSKSIRLWNTQGASITGNRGNSNAQIEFSSGTNLGISIVGNSINAGAVYVLTGSATIANYAAFGNASDSNIAGTGLYVRGGATGASSTPFVSFLDSAGTEAGFVGPRSAAANDMYFHAGKGNGVKIQTNGSTDRLTIAADGSSVFSGSLAIGSGTPVKSVVSAAAILNFPPTRSRSSSDLTIRVPGAAVGGVVSTGLPNGSIAANSHFTAWVSGSNTVTMRFNNYSGETIDPAAGTFRVMVTNF